MGHSFCLRFSLNSANIKILILWCTLVTKTGKENEIIMVIMDKAQITIVIVTEVFPCGIVLTLLSSQ